MQEFHILQDLMVVFAVAGAVVFLFQRLKIPSVVGLLAAGLIVGPYGLRLVGEVEQVRLLAEVGVVVLLFAVGLEFSLSRLLAMWRVMLLVGVPQVAICLFVTTLAMLGPLGDLGPAVFAGMLVAMSSTAVVLKVLNDRGELGAPQGRLSVAVLLLQDLLVTVFMLLMPLLASKGEGVAQVLLRLAQGVGVVVMILVGSRYAITPMLFHVVRTRNRELFLIFVFLMCIGTALLTAWAGLSLALGAFLAGLALSESEYANQMFSEVLPFRDTLSSLFFVSVGMLLDLRFVFGHPGLVSLTVVAILLLKFLAAGLPTLLVGYPLRVAVLTGAALFQVGEFSFVLAGRGMEEGLLNSDQYQTFLSAAVVTMVLTPFAIAASPRAAHRLSRIPALRRWAEGRVSAAVETEPVESRLRDHVIIVGFGIGGQNLARVLQSVEVPYVILEMNPEAVRRSRAEGEPIAYGDCTRAEVLEHMGIARARVLVIAISDPGATRRAVQIARRLNPTLHIVVRTRYISEIDELKTLGADEIIPEDLVTSVELFARVLREYHVPRNQVIDLIDRVRSDQYEALRVRHPERLNLLQNEIAAHGEIDSCLIREDSPAVGRTVGELRLRSETGATLLSVRRRNQMLTNPDAGLRFQPDDVAVLFGDRGQIDDAVALLDPGMKQAPSLGPTPRPDHNSRATEGVPPA